ncbi:flagellar biosynthetic protein FliO [Ensifer sp. HO-A22]|uniref:Flagellar biosynthetic protein FliO n=1 Tax=Ensifer oleiphilus TaxID=2742698 RepID=A0A7Y6Q4E5_9HYPH|nr:flagellar biosynthetic protein FliO [Ensifer oleiphilus]NVD38665.1 flagellar biosynthetic protein FliO [Ensifer oleiphilus]
MMETIVGDNGSRFIIAAGAVAIGLLCLVAVLYIMRNRPSSPFIRGGKNRQPRLAVLDAAAVDTRRRLVLVRRDDVEHLIMIGGPTDIVIESRIAPIDESASANDGPAVIERKPIEPTVAIGTETKTAAQAQLRPAAAQTEAAVAMPVRPVAMPQEQPVARSEPAPAVRAVAEQRPVPAMAVEPRPVARVAPPAPEIIPPEIVPQVNTNGAQLNTADKVEGIFDAARSRVLQPQPPIQERRPTPVAQPTPVTEGALSDFERILDAEISGDLQRLTPSSAAARPESRAAVAATTARQEPLLGAPLDDARKEPTIEEEMNRMLADISAGRKP